ncbi:MAG: polymerase, partial [Thermotogaceae bacterium]|nr:polymerase [Thermotogaceae bacterium]
MSKRLFLIDGTALIYRAFFAMDDSLATSTGIPTNSSYGVARMLTKFIKEHLKSGDYIAFALDKKTVTYRHELLKDYKANRPKTPDKMLQQIPYIKRLVKALGIKVLEIENFEADDLIATLATKGKKHFDEIYIITGDKDMLQLVDDKIRILRVGYKGLTELELVDREYVIKRYEITPEQIPDLLALVGDVSDNIPGVKGIGPKNATRLLSKYGNLEGIYEHLDELPERLAQLLAENKDTAFLSKRLTRLVSDIDLDLDWENFKYQSYDRKELLNIFKELEFSSLIKEYQLYDEMSEEVDYKIVDDQEKLHELLKVLEDAEVVSLDLETTSLSPIDAKIVGIALSTRPESGYYIPVGHQTGEKQLDAEKVLPELIETLKGSKIIGQNLKFDYSILYTKGYDFQIDFDTMIAAYLLDPDQKRFGLDELAIKYLKYKPISYDELFTTGTLFGSGIENLPVDKVAKYS